VTKILRFLIIYYFCVANHKKTKDKLAISANIGALTDEQIIDEYKKTSDKSWVGELYKRYTRFVFLVSMKYLKNEERCQDAVMQIFEKLFTDFHKHKIEKFKPWLHTVTRNHCLILLRKDQSVLQKEKKFQIEQDLFMETEDDLHLDNTNDKDKQLSCLKEAILDLNQEQKVCIEMFYLQEKSYKEIADETGFSEKKVKSYIQNGKRNLKIKLMKMTAGLLLLVYLLVG
jgi:RNA polymerase sigma factor (sigma-70 family)